MVEDISSTPPELRQLATTAVDNLLPTKSKDLYEKEYNNFTAWCTENNVQNVTENVLLAFFEIKSKNYKCSTLWKSYSMIKSVLNIRQNIDISKFVKLQAFLKRCSSGYEPRKSKILEYHDIEKFINGAPDLDYLAMKVILIMGYSGACRRDEITKMSTNDIEYKTDSIFVTVPKTKTNHPRLFAVTNKIWFNLIKKYASLRPASTNHRRFFIFYRRGRCTVQPIGLNKIGEVPKIIARYLNLESPDSFSGHCFRRSSASNLANNGGDLITVKRHGGWKSSTVAEGYVDASTKKRLEVAEMLSNSSKASTSGASSLFSTMQSLGSVKNNKENNNVLNSLQNIPGISINAGDNATISIKVFNNCSENKED